ncbi:Zn2/Cys6 DNA-binding protein [Glarea lozoyensis ATCC 20868]|uniref:Zn2/Cys6 DNA-binding protein n=1 Tax=Glarea lozoyensis (strain ATCC 20868 / MF5171) TaxID=1116229 RepID=S3D6X3_GLAL2|nr:Zn2/Cys6 DNA-binding protein [Glarea lozoyensis ATCC 20868]EPE32869.1 Zn2/Cys6 DNA-binding protein [Glarea lozoyensis ATCC 20868]
MSYEIFMGDASLQLCALSSRNAADDFSVAVIPESRIIGIRVTSRMRASGARPTCSRCSRRFTKEGGKGLIRQKACHGCASSKVRCDIQKPTCGRCRDRNLNCEYLIVDERRNDVLQRSSRIKERGQVDEPLPTHHLTENHHVLRLPHQPGLSDGSTSSSASSGAYKDALRNGEDIQTSVSSTLEVMQDQNSNNHLFISTATHTDPGTDEFQSALSTELEPVGLDFSLPGTPPDLRISEHRRRVLLGIAARQTSTQAGETAPTLTSNHTMHFVIRVLKSWPRTMAMHYTDNLPPIIHKVQLEKGVPEPLAYCFTLVRMWAGYADGSRELVLQTILKEVRRLNDEYPYYDEMNLLAAVQSLIILLIILFFGLGQSEALAHPIDGQLLVDAWEMKHTLAATGLFLDQELDHTLPSWKDWAVVSAKRRTILALHHLEWAWSHLHGYPLLTCLSLGPFPAPAARYLWQAGNEQEWQTSYRRWLVQWVGGVYRMLELFYIDPGVPLSVRCEMWLGEVDEFGMMLMAEGAHFSPAYENLSDRKLIYSTS